MCNDGDKAGLSDLYISKVLDMFCTITHDMAYLTCSISFQSLLYKNAKDASHRSRLSSEMMIYHMTVSIGDYYMALSHKDWELPNSRI